MSADELSSAKATLETQKSELEAERDRLKEKLDVVEESSKKLAVELEVKMAILVLLVCHLVKFQEIFTHMPASPSLKSSVCNYCIKTFTKYTQNF